MWEVQMAVLQGFDVDISDIGGWSLDVHHHYNFHEGKIKLYIKHKFEEIWIMFCDYGWNWIKKFKKYIFINKTILLPKNLIK